MIVDVLRTKNIWAKRVVPVVLFLSFGYINYSLGYVVGYQEVYHYHSRAVAIVLWVLLGFFELALICYWTTVLLIGPGAATKILPFNLYGDAEDKDLLPVPDYFVCDKDGYPFWCSTCQSLKPIRSFHLRDLNYCVPKFDHYCIWLGTVVGKANHIWFFKFLQNISAIYLLCIVFAARYMRPKFNRNGYSVNLHYVALIIYGLLGLLMTLVLFLSHVKYIYYNMTTLDDLSKNQMKRYFRWQDRYTAKKDAGKSTSSLEKRAPRKETGKRYLNIMHNNKRVVVQYYIKDFPFTRGFRQNLINLTLNNNENTNDNPSFYSSHQYIRAWSLLMLPFIDLLRVKRTGAGQEHITEEFLQHIHNKAEEGKYTVPKYLQTTTETGTAGESYEKSTMETPEKEDSEGKGSQVDTTAKNDK